MILLSGVDCITNYDTFPRNLVVFYREYYLEKRHNYNISYPPPYTCIHQPQYLSIICLQATIFYDEDLIYFGQPAPIEAYVVHSDGQKELLYSSSPFTSISATLTPTAFLNLTTILNKQLEIVANSPGHTDISATVDFCGDTYTAATSVDVSFLLNGINNVLKCHFYLGYFLFIVWTPNLYGFPA